MEYCKDNLRVRINEDEGPLLNRDNRVGNVSKQGSSSWKEG